jgi:hypothetical protein
LQVGTYFLIMRGYFYETDPEQFKIVRWTAYAKKRNLYSFESKKLMNTPPRKPVQLNYKHVHYFSQ